MNKTLLNYEGSTSVLLLSGVLAVSPMEAKDSASLEKPGSNITYKLVQDQYIDETEAQEVQSQEAALAQERFQQLLSFASKFIQEQVDLEPESQKILNEKFWDLV
jgi:hypothetical protein